MLQLFLQQNCVSDSILGGYNAPASWVDCLPTTRRCRFRWNFLLPAIENDDSRGS